MACQKDILHFRYVLLLLTERHIFSKLMALERLRQSCNYLWILWEMEDYFFPPSVLISSPSTISYTLTERQLPPIYPFALFTTCSSRIQYEALQPMWSMDHQNSFAKWFIKTKHCFIRHRITCLTAFFEQAEVIVKYHVLMTPLHIGQKGEMSLRCIQCGTAESSDSAIRAVFLIWKKRDYSTSADCLRSKKELHRANEQYVQLNVVALQWGRVKLLLLIA